VVVVVVMMMIRGKSITTTGNCGRCCSMTQMITLIIIDMNKTPSSYPFSFHHHGGANAVK
jgi:hypothetical protein